MNLLLKCLILSGLLLSTSSLLSQCASSMCDPEIESVTLNLVCLSQNQNAVLTVKWKMNGECLAPSGSWRIQISLPVSGVYGSTGVADITRPSIFNWTYNNIDKAFTGVSNQAISQSPTDSIKINVSGLILNSCAPVGTQVNISIVSGGFPFFGCPAAFQNDTNNDSGASFMGVQQQLPVTLSDFYAKAISCNKIELYWETDSEKNNDYFEIERSLNGKDFFKIGKIFGTNASNGSSYTFTDETNLNGKSLFYYRLRQVDFDGIFENFNIIKIENHCDNDNVSIALYPNPAFDRMNVELTGFKAIDYVDLVITNAIGEIIKKFNKISVNKVHELNIRELNPGVYTLKVLDTDVSLVKRFIKVE